MPPAGMALLMEAAPVRMAVTTPENLLFRLEG